MKIISGDLWNFEGTVVIPTNCSYNRLGQATMGRGTAFQAAQKYPGLKNALGKRLKQTNRAPDVHVFAEWKIVCFPVKRFWSDKASISMIRVGLRRLVELADELDLPIYLPLVGCGFGELSEEKILPLLMEFLDDRFILVKRGDHVANKYPKSFIPSIRNDRSLVG